MNLSLQYCDKCKRKTIQVFMKLLTEGAWHSALCYMEWATATGRKDNLADEEEKKEILVRYCPQCGKYWHDCTEKITRNETKEITVKRFDRINWEDS